MPAGANGGETRELFQNPPFYDRSQDLRPHFKVWGNPSFSSQWEGWTLSNWQEFSICRGSLVRPQQTLLYCILFLPAFRFQALWARHCQFPPQITSYIVPTGPKYCLLFSFPIAQTSGYCLKVWINGLQSLRSMIATNCQAWRGAYRPDLTLPPALVWGPDPHLHWPCLVQGWITAR